MAEHKNNFHTRWLSVAEATPQITTFGKNILKHTLHQFASEFLLCFLKNIGIIKNLCVKKIAKDAIKKRLTKNQ